MSSMNSFFGFDMGLRALNYFRQGMDTAGHNISNADVEGYSRQRVDASTSDPYADVGLNRPGTAGQVGTGVQIDAISRVRDAFLDAQYQEEIAVKGYWTEIQEAINQVETYVTEPAGSGFQDAMDGFWTALQEASKRPDDTAVREDLVEYTKTLTTFLDQLQTNFQQYRTSVNQDVGLEVDKANDLIDQIATLNGTISSVQAVGGNPNDLLDQRDLMAEQLCQITGCTVGSPGLDEADGDYKIDLNGKLLVQGSLTRHLVAVPISGNDGFYDVQVEDNLYDPVGDLTVATAVIEQNAPEATHALEVVRLANEEAWQVGGGDGLLTVTDPDKALDLQGTFGLQVDTGGVRKTSAAFAASGGNPAGTVLTGSPGATDVTRYQFRIAAGDFEGVVTVEWNGTDGKWDISDNLGSAAMQSDDATLNLTDLRDFIGERYGNVLDVSVSSTGTELTLASDDRELLSINDLAGNLTSRLGLENEGTAVYIEVTADDTLTTIANKINGAYSSALASEDPPKIETDPAGTAPAAPEEWLRALIKQDPSNGNYYLTLESDLVGEGQRINVITGLDCSGSSGGSFYVAEKLGFVNADDSTAVVNRAQDAYFKFDDKEYLSESNALNQARLITGGDGWTADTLQEVSSGLRFELVGEGTTNILVRHAVKGGTLKGMMEGRDDIILDQIDSFDEIAYELATEMNALHYAGHGRGDYADTTGTAFFASVGVRYGASSRLELSDEMSAHSEMFAASGDDGSGATLGSGDGSLALKMAQLKQSEVLGGDSADFDAYYDGFIAKLGAIGERAATMKTNQTALVSQIDAQRQSVMGVNIDEEMTSIIRYQQAYNAIARYITTVDEMLDKVINGMGRVGL
jgi:flagellar hook-associated protein 1 FlgK